MAEAVFNVLKISVIVFIAFIFLIAINALIQTIGSIVMGSVVGEFFGIVSCCLPFNALAVFGALGTSVAAIFAFLIAKKIFDLTSWSVSAV